MKIKLDENLPEGLVVALTGLGHDVDTAVREGLGGRARLRVPGRTALFDRVLSLFRTEDVASWTGGLVIATERKLRVRRAER